MSETCTRPWTADRKNWLTGTTRMTVKRCCNGCGRQLGDVTRAELDAAVSGRNLPDVRLECGCLVHRADWTARDPRPMCAVHEYAGHDGPCTPNPPTDHPHDEPGVSAGEEAEHG